MISATRERQPLQARASIHIGIGTRALWRLAVVMAALPLFGGCTYKDVKLDPRYLVGEIEVDHADGILANGTAVATVGVTLHDSSNEARPIDMLVRLQFQPADNLTIWVSPADGVVADENGFIATGDDGFAAFFVTGQATRPIHLQVQGSVVVSSPAEDAPIILPEPITLTFVSSLEESVGFSPPVTLQSGAGPIAIVTARSNPDDAVDDLVALNGAAATITRWNGAPIVGLSFYDQQSVGGQPRSLAAVELHRDAEEESAASPERHDEIAIGLAEPNEIRLYRQHESSIEWLETEAVAAVPYSIAFGSFDSARGSGPYGPDLATTGAEGGMTVFLYAGAPLYASLQELGTGLAPTAIAVGLLADNGDGAVDDVVVANTGSDSIAVFQGATGVGLVVPASCPQTIQLGSCELEVAAEPIAVGIGDFNLDGLGDIVVLSAQELSLQVLLHDEGPEMSFSDGGTYATVPPASAPARPSALAVADLNRDGVDDVIVATAASELLVFLGDGDGRLVMTTTLPTGRNPVAVAVGDYNGDSIPDVVSADAGNSTVTVRYGRK